MQIVDGKITVFFVTYLSFSYLSVTDLHDIADLVELSSFGNTFLWFVLSGLLLLFFLAALLFFYFLRRERLVKKSASLSKEDALKEFNEIILPLAEKNQSKAFLSAVEHLIRRYIEAYFSITCREKTVKELLDTMPLEDSAITEKFCALLKKLIQYEGVKFADKTLSQEAYREINKGIEEIIQL